MVQAPLNYGEEAMGQRETLDEGRTSDGIVQHLLSPMTQQTFGLESQSAVQVLERSRQEDKLLQPLVLEFDDTQLRVTKTR